MENFAPTKDLKKILVIPNSHTISTTEQFYFSYFTLAMSNDIKSAHFVECYKNENRLKSL